MLCYKFLLCFKFVYIVVNIIIEFVSLVLKMLIGFGEIKIEE